MNVDDLNNSMMQAFGDETAQWLHGSRIIPVRMIIENVVLEQAFGNSYQLSTEHKQASCPANIINGMVRGDKITLSDGDYTVLRVTIDQGGWAKLTMERL